MKLTSSLETNFRRVALTCLGLSSLLSGTVMVAWWLGQRRVGVFDITPSTLVLMVGLSFAAWVSQARSNAAQWLGVLIGLVTFGMNILMFAQHVSRYQWPGENWWAVVLGTAGGLAGEVRRVHISKLAAFSFLLAHAAWLLQCRLAFRTRVVRQVSAVFALAVLLIGLVTLLCYLLQSAYYTQMAFLAKVGLILVGSGLLLTAGLDNWPLTFFFVPEDLSPSGRRFFWGMASLALLLTATVAATGKVYYKSQQFTARRAAWETLATVADLKVAQIADWWQERLADAQYMRRTPYVSERAVEILEGRDTSQTAEVFNRRLSYLFADKPFDQVLLLDREFNVRLTYPKKVAVKVSESVRQAVERALDLKEVVVSDLERRAEGPERLSIVVPLLGSTSKDGLSAHRHRGALVLQINARDSLFPLLERWPAPHSTAETLLFRKERDDVVILNQLRSSTNAPLTLRLPLDRSSLEARSVLGQGKDEGRVFGPDYRRVPVMGIWRRIPNTQWMLLVKVDEAEIYEPLLRQAWTTAGLVGLLIGIGMLGAVLLGRQRNLIATQRELLLERQHREAEMMFRTLAQVSPVGIFRTDAAGNCLYVNERWSQITGLTPEVARETGWAHAVHPDDRALVSVKWNHALVENSPFALEFRFQRPDGKVTWVLGQDAALPSGSGESPGRIGTITDITESKQAEVALLEISDREQARIGQDLHDGLCQNLVGIALAAQAFERKLDRGGPPDPAAIQNISNLLDEAITQARQTARGLFPVELDAEGLAGALRSLAASTSLRPGIICELEYPEPVFIRDNDIATQLYRVAQEAVNNAVKHGRPKRILIRLIRNNGKIELTVLDDGIGIPAPHRSNGGMGLSIMEYRAKTIGGTFAVRRRSEGGTAVSCFVYDRPFSARADAQRAE